MTADMEQAAAAFKWLAAFLRGKGRRMNRAERENRMRRVTVQPGAAGVVKMAPRAVRRARVLELREGAKGNRKARREAFPFRPVYGHAIPAADHKAHIQVLTTKDPVQAEAWMTKIVVGRALTDWGMALHEHTEIE